MSNVIDLNLVRARRDIEDAGIVDPYLSVPAEVLDHGLDNILVDERLDAMPCRGGVVIFVENLGASLSREDAEKLAYQILEWCDRSGAA
jgi:hypothetical protein